MSYILKPHWKVTSVGLLIKKGKLLLGLRPSEKKREREIWEFPGGSVEAGENPEQTMVRELKEELGIEVLKSNLALCLCDHKKKYSRLIVFFYVTRWKGEIQKSCHEDLRWFSYEECLEKKVPNINPTLFHTILSAVSKKLAHR